MKSSIISRYRPASSWANRNILTLLKKAVGRFIPAAVIPEIRPNLPTVAARLADKRDSLQQNDPSNELQNPGTELPRADHAEIHSIPYCHDQHYHRTILVALDLSKALDTVVC